MNANNGILKKDLSDFLEKTGSADVVIGIPSHNNAGTIKNVIKNYVSGIQKYYPDLKCAIINSDGRSKDGTVKIVNSLDMPGNISLFSTIYKGESGKGSSFKTIFEAARRLNARVCVVSDSDTRSIKPDWVFALINPILNLGYGYVTPYYTRDKHDGTITNVLVYPAVRALYGLRVRQPIGGDFAFSSGVLQVFLQEKYWKKHPYISKFGVDIWMTATAINEGFRVCQTVLGTKQHDEKDPGSQLSLMFKQVTGTMFEMLKDHELRWKNIVHSNQGFIFGDFKFMEVKTVKVDYGGLVEKFHEGHRKYKDVWKEIFSQSTFKDLRNIIKSAPEKPLLIPVHLWAKMVYDYACVYNFINADERELLLDSLLPLYFIRTASFIREAEFFSDEIADAVVEGDAGVFERMKGYLVKRWDYFKQSNACRSIKASVID